MTRLNNGQIAIGAPNSLARAKQTAIPQGTTLTLKHNIQFPNPFTGRHNLWRAGKGYWVASPEYVQVRDGIVEVCKRGVPMGKGMRFVADLVSEHFEVL